MIDIKVGESLGHLLVGKDLDVKYALLLFIVI